MQFNSLSFSRISRWILLPIIVTSLVSGFVYAAPGAWVVSQLGMDFVSYFQENSSPIGLESDSLHIRGNNSWIAHPTTGANYLGGTTYLGTSGTGIITASGNVGIGTTTPSESLTISGTVLATGNITAATPTASGHLATKAYVDAAVSAGGGQLNVYKSDGTTLIGKFLGMASMRDAPSLLDPSIYAANSTGSVIEITFAARGGYRTTSWFSGPNCTGTEYWEPDYDYNTGQPSGSVYHYSKVTGKIYQYNIDNRLNQIYGYSSGSPTTCTNYGYYAYMLSAGDVATYNPNSEKPCGPGDCLIK